MRIGTSSQPNANALGRDCPRSQRAFTLAETIISMAVTVMSLGGVVSGYIFATRQAEWSAYSLAAQSLATQRLEQTRAAQWNPRSSPIVDEVTAGNFPTVATNILDIPVSGSNTVYATSITTINDASSGGYPLKMIRIDCVWPFRDQLYTNTVATYRAPDQ